jgi:hypothetical protein
MYVCNLFLSKFHMPCLSESLIIAVIPVDKYIFRVIAMLLIQT